MPNNEKLSYWDTMVKAEKSFAWWKLGAVAGVCLFFSACLLGSGDNVKGIMLLALALLLFSAAFIAHKIKSQ
jgi:hypothetical protein